MSDFDRQSLHNFLTGRYDLEGLRTLCLYLDVDYDNLDGRTKDSLARELIRYMVRVGRERELVTLQEQAEAVLARGRTTESRTTITHDPRRVFISHAHQDAAFAHRLAADLERAGIPVWIAPEGIRPGEQWLPAIARGLQESGVCAVVLTPDGVASSWVDYETNLAISRERKKQMSLLLLDVAECDVPFGWTGYHLLSFRGEYSVGLGALRARLEASLNADAHVEWLKSLPDKVFPGKLIQGSPPKPDRRIHEKTGIELIRIPAGPFVFGSVENDKWGRYDERPARAIDLPEYWIARYLVTNGQYKRFIDQTNYSPPSHWKGKVPPRDKIDHPVVDVDLDDANAFCSWAKLTLPTEEQWEKAARGTEYRTWPWGDQPPTNKHCNFGSEVGTTTPVGKYSPLGDSPYGCADMAGNVWEITVIQREMGRILHGGAWNNGGGLTRIAYFNEIAPHWVHDGVSFRVVELLSDPAS